MEKTSTDRKKKVNKAQEIASVAGKQPSEFVQGIAEQYANGDITSEKAKEAYIQSIARLSESTTPARHINDNLAGAIKAVDETHRIIKESCSTLEAFSNMNANNALIAATEANSSLKRIKGISETLNPLRESCVANTINTISIVKDTPSFKFQASLWEQVRINSGMEKTIQLLNSNVSRLFADSLKSVAKNFGAALSQGISSPALEWIRSIDVTPMRTILETLRLDEDIVKRYREFNDAYLLAMYECKWFPYAGWVADFSLTSEVFNILSTSRGVSARREKRMDKAILSYYTPQEVKDIKRSWKNSDLEPYIKKMLGQAIDAHLRGEFILTIACLSTLWEGLIHRRLGITGRYGQKKTKEDFAKLIEENNFKPIFADFYDNLIVSQCDTPEDMIDGVPNRNGVSHSKHKKYPNRKASLNAILLTDFIIRLEPMESPSGTEQ